MDAIDMILQIIHAFWTSSFPSLLSSIFSFFRYGVQLFEKLCFQIVGMIFFDVKKPVIFNQLWKILAFPSLKLLLDKVHTTTLVPRLGFTELVNYNRVIKSSSSLIG